MGAQNTSTVDRARGRDAHFRNGMRRPFFDLHRSDRDAIHGSVTASKMRPRAVMAPITVKIPSNTRPWGMNTVCPAAMEAASGW